MCRLLVSYLSGSAFAEFRALLDYQDGVYLIDNGRRTYPCLPQTRRVNFN